MTCAPGRSGRRPSSTRCVPSGRTRSRRCYRAEALRAPGSWWGHTKEGAQGSGEPWTPSGAGQRLPNRRLIATSLAVISIRLRLLPLSSQVRSATVPVTTTRVPLATEAAT